MAKMDKYPAKVTIIFFNPMIQGPDVSLIEKTQHPFFKLATAFTRNDLYQSNPLVYSFCHNPVEFRLNPLTAIIDVVQIQG